MGQALKKLTHGSDEKKEQEIAQMAEKYFDLHFDESKDWTLAEFYQAVCEAVEELNKKMGSTQIKVPKTEQLDEAYKKHHMGKGKPVSKEEFEKIMKDVMMESGVTGIGAKDMLMYLFGVPFTALMIKRRLIPKAIPDEFFIPGVTSATVLALAVLNKL